MKIPDVSLWSVHCSHSSSVVKEPKVFLHYLFSAGCGAMPLALRVCTQTDGKNYIVYRTNIAR